jgi:uncharacterized OsmC-like protein
MKKTVDTITLAAHSSALRKDQGALRKRYRSDAPGEALVTDTASSIARAGDSPMWGSVQIGVPSFGVTVPVGVHRAVGGMHDLPVPGDILCAALVACVDTTIRILSNNLRIPLEALEVDVESDCDVRGTLLVDPSVRVGFDVMRVSVKAVPGPGVAAKQVQGMVQLAEQCCVVLQTLKNGVDVAFQLDVGEESKPPGVSDGDKRDGAIAGHQRD